MSKERWQEEIRGQKRTITPHWITVQNKPGSYTTQAKCLSTTGTVIETKIGNWEVVKCTNCEYIEYQHRGG